MNTFIFICLLPFSIISIIFLIKDIDNKLNNKLNNKNNKNNNIYVKNFLSFNEALNNKEELNEAFNGNKPVIINSNGELCINPIHLKVEKNNVYVEIFNDNDTTVFNEYFGEHITLHMIGDYTKNYETGNIFHKDVYIPEFIREYYPNIIENIMEQQKHIVCSCNGSKIVSIINRYDTKKILNSNYTTVMEYPKPVIIKKKYERKVLSKINRYKFLLKKNQCLIFNPFLQFHSFTGNKNSITQIHFFVLNKYSKYANLIMPVENIDNKLKKLYNRNIYKLKK